MVITAIALLLVQHWMIAPALALVLGACLVVRGVRLFASERRKSGPVARIDRISPGEAEIHGAATGPYSITAPITGKKCYLYRTTVWQQKLRSDGWEKLADETLHVPFYIDDSTGQMLIEPMGADLEIPRSLREEYGGSFSDANTIPPSVSAFLARHRATPAGRMLIEESCIEPQSEIFATGTVTGNPGIEVKPLVPKTANGRASNGQPDGPEIIRLSDASSAHAAGARTQQSRIAAALIKAGIQNPNAWAAAGLPAPDAPGSATAVLSAATTDDASQQNSESSGFNLTPAFVLMKGYGDAPFVLSSRASRPAVQCHWEDPVSLAVGVALTFASLWIFVRNLL
jgi:hypothetical protein